VEREIGSQGCQSTGLADHFPNGTGIASAEVARDSGPSVMLWGDPPEAPTARGSDRCPDPNMFRAGNFAMVIGAGRVTGGGDGLGTPLCDLN
jgi:hypothetical protein